jgi:dUTP pyrophosphatase
MVKIDILKNGISEPTYGTAGASGMDVRSNEDSVIPAHGTKLVKTGLFLAIPEGYEIQVRPRSGLALKNGITVLNTPGTIDSDYRGEIGVILFNVTDTPFNITKGDRIAQLVLAKYERAEFNFVEKLPDSSRGEGGYGSTGKN